jgi:prophage regulatory protein
MSDITRRLLERLLGIRELVLATTLSKPTIYRKMKEGTFPYPIKLGGRRVAWRESDIAEWLDQQAGVTA